MWEILLASVLSLSAGIRAPQIDNVPNDFELAYQIENELFMFKHDYERENGIIFNDIRGKINYEYKHLLVKEDYQEITSKNLYIFTSDIRYAHKGLSAGGAYLWNINTEEAGLTFSAGYTEEITKGKWEINTDSDIYLTTPLSFQTDLKTSYNINQYFGIGILGNYIQTTDNNDYAAKIILTIKFK